MATSGRGSGVVGYNVQAAVDTEHHLIVAHEVTTSGSDRSQLAPMSKLTKEGARCRRTRCRRRSRLLHQRTDTRMHRGRIVSVTLPKPQTSNNRLRGQFGKADFRYVASEDMYICPAGEALLFVSHKREPTGLTCTAIATRACSRAIKRCTTSSNHRSITRWEHEHVLEDVQRRLDENPQAMRVRRETVEHPFGTIKARMGATHFLMKRLKNVKTEMALAVLAYNLTRVMNIIGIGPLMKAIRT
jgi:hypothetical protein